MLLEELHRRGYFTPEQIEQAAQTLDNRENGKSDIMVETKQCKCWAEVSLLDDNDDVSPYQLFLYNMTGDDVAFLSLRDKYTNELYNTTYIHYCPLCGRFLK